MAFHLKKAGVILLGGFSVASGTGPYMEGSLQCRMLPCALASAERDPQASCPPGDCTWKTTSSTCEASAQLMGAYSTASLAGDMIALYGDSFYGRMMVRTASCAQKAQADCSGDCVWSDKCVGNTLQWLSAPEMRPMMTCSMKRTQQDCAAAGCLWGPNPTSPSVIGCGPSKADMMALYGCSETAARFAPPTTPAPSSADSPFCRASECSYANAAANKQASCVGECSWNSGTSECSISQSLSAAFAAAGPNNPVQIYGNRGPYSRMMAEQQNCANQQQATCSGSCVWHQTEQALCVISGTKYMELLGPVQADLQNRSDCSKYNASQGCQTAGCVWISPPGVLSGCQPKKELLHKLYGCGAYALASGAGPELRAGAAAAAALALWAGAWVVATAELRTA